MPPSLIGTRTGLVRGLGAERRAGLLELDHIDARDERIVCTTAATADEHEA
jgi:hypothetical protein